MKLAEDFESLINKDEKNFGFLGYDYRRDHD